MNINKEEYSVLIGVYYKEKPQSFIECIESILNQTIKTNDFVIVCDGPLTKELDDVLELYTSKHDFFNIIRLPENKGLGIALNIAIKECKNEIIMRMDSDDVSIPNRAEIQLEMIKHCDACSGAVSEFKKEFNDLNSVRALPLEHKKLVKFTKMRSPLNHPAVMFKKSSVIASGSYVDMPFKEDYCLWVMMIKNGAILANTNEILVHMRIDDTFVDKRFCKAGKKSQYKIKKIMYDAKLMNVFEYCVLVTAQFIVNICPKFVKEFIYKKILRSKRK